MALYIAQGFSFSCLSCFWLELSVANLHPSLPLSEVSPWDLVMASCASRISGALVLPVLLEFLPGAAHRMVDFSAMCRIFWVLGSAAAGREGGWRPGEMRASMHGSLCCVQCFKLMGSAAVGLEERLWYHVHLSGWRSSVSGPTSNAAQLPVATGAQVTAVWRLELYAPPPLLLLHSLESLGCRYHLHYSPGPTSSCLFQSTHL